MKKVALLSVISFVVTISVIAGFSRPAIAQETYTIVNRGGDPAIPDVIVSGDNSVRYDVDTIEGQAGQQNTVAVAIDAATTWNLTAQYAGTIIIQGYSRITFIGIDNLVGGTGKDTFIFSPGMAFSGSIDGGDGANTLDYSAYLTGVTVNLATQTATGTNGIAHIENVIGGEGSDTLMGDSQDNVFTGGPGKDIITGGDGCDTIVETRDANFTLTDKKLTIGVEDYDTLSGIEAGRLTGGSGNNTLDAWSFSGSVVLDGAGGNDTLIGGSGDDVLIGGPGDDALTGGPGDDVYTGGPGINIITEESDGGDDTVVETCDENFTLTETSLTWSEGVDTFSNIETIVPNQPPTADAGPDQSVRAGDTVSLDGAGSYDDNTVSTSLRYVWSFFKKPDSNAILANADTKTPSFVVDVAGTYVVQLIVTDEYGLAGEPDLVTISSANLAPKAIATVDYSLVVIGETACFNGSDSTDPEGDSLSYAWEITAAPAGSTAALVGGNTATPTLTPDLSGAYEVTLVVSDSLGPGDDPATVTLIALTGEDFAELNCYDAGRIVSALTLSQVTTKGNQTALLNFLQQAVVAMQAGDLATAIDKLQKAMERTDGCVLRGAPDGNGPGRDWITDCDAQDLVYPLLHEALEALTP